MFFAQFVEHYFDEITFPYFSNCVKKIALR